LVLFIFQNLFILRKNIKEIFVIFVFVKTMINFAN